MLGILMGVPAVGAVSLVQMMDDDSRLQSLNRDLDHATTEQARLQHKAATYADNTDALRANLDVLRKKEIALRATLDAAPAPGDGPLPAHKMRLLNDGADALATSKKLLGNLQEQIATLEQIRDAAGELGRDLDGVIDDLRKKEAKANKLVAQSEKELMDLVRIVTSPDPEQAATKWMTRTVAKRTEAVLKQLGLSVKAYAADLAKRAVPGSDDASKQLRKQLSSWLLKRVSGQDAGRAPRLDPASVDVAHAPAAAGLDD
jgi:uncharacterized protein YoxC